MPTRSDATITTVLHTDNQRPDADLAAGRRVLEHEAAALTALATALDGAFTRAIGMLSSVSGRVVVTGMGKSGHVARKIAATFASTGTPALFVHPGEASHGDLGMIARGDAIIALSNSGETSELAAIVSYSRRFGIPLVGITSGARSALAEQSDVALILPAVGEACPLGLAPTTSTTMMLGLGDALAIALLERRGFSADDYRELHPGGKLGARLLKVKDIMRTGLEVPLVSQGTIMSDAILTMTAIGFGVVGVTGADGRLVGIITDGDLRRHMGADLLQRTVDVVMTAGPRTIAPDALAVEALAVMNMPGGAAKSGTVNCLFVIDEARTPLGLLRVHDVLAAGVA